MEHIAALLLVIGCSGDLNDCREIPAPNSVFEAYNECEQVLPETRQAMNGLRPRVFAQCLFVDPAEDEDAAQLVWNVDKATGLNAQIVFEQTVAQNAAAPANQLR